MLFFKSHCQWLGKQLQETKIMVRSKKIAFNKKATHWLGVWLDSQLKFNLHINKRVQRAQNAEIQIKGLTQLHRLVFRLV